MNNSSKSLQPKNRSGKIFFIIGLIVIIIFGFYISSFAQRSNFDITMPFGESGLTIGGLNIGGLVQEKRLALKGEGEDRTNILILGQDYVGITDTIIILSYYYQEKKITTFSLPRDLRVNDGFGTYKINAMYELASQRLAAGIDDAKPEVFMTSFLSRQLGIPIHYWATINIEGSSQIIDELGGLDITVDNSFSDCEYPTDNYQEVFYPELRQRLPYIRPCPKFVAGPSKMDSRTALIFARSRKSFDNPAEAIDFARSKRQAKVIEGTINKLKSEFSSGKALLDLPKVSRFFQIAGDNFKTSLDINEAVSFARLLKDEPPDPKIQAFSLDFESGAVCQDRTSSDIVLCGGSAFGSNNFSAAQSRVQDIARNVLEQATNRQNNNVTFAIVGNGSDQTEKVQQALTKAGFDANKVLLDNKYNSITQAKVNSTEKATFFIPDKVIRERIIKTSKNFDFEFTIQDSVQSKYNLAGNYGKAQVIILVETVT